MKFQSTKLNSYKNKPSQHYSLRSFISCFLNCSTEIPEVTTTVTPDQVDEIDAQSLNSHHSNSEEFVDYDYLDDIEHNKDIYRLKVPIVSSLFHIGCCRLNSIK